ncbi:MAG: proton-conducting transporter membrane subunit [Hymenobacter sp.]
MLAHGVNVVGMFLVADAIERRTGTRHIADLGGLTRRTPLLSVCFLVMLLSTVALPLTGGFVGEFLLLAGVYEFNMWAGAVAGLTIIFSAVYLLRMYQRVMLGPDSAHSDTITDLTGGRAGDVRAAYRAGVLAGLVSRHLPCTCPSLTISSILTAVGR